MLSKHLQLSGNRDFLDYFELPKDNISAQLFVHLYDIDFGYYSEKSLLDIDALSPDELYLDVTPVVICGADSVRRLDKLFASNPDIKKNVLNNLEEYTGVSDYHIFENGTDTQVELPRTIFTFELDKNEVQNGGKIKANLTNINVSGFGSALNDEGLFSILLDTDAYDLILDDMLEDYTNNLKSCGEIILQIDA